VRLRLAGVEEELLVLYSTPYEVESVVRWDLQPALQDLEQIKRLNSEALRQEKRLRVHLHLDTGMSRLGCRPNEVLALAQAIESASHLELYGLMTHLACAEDPEQDAFTQQQLDRFSQTLALLRCAGINPPWRHAANTAGAVRFETPDCTMMRPGLGLLGLCASPPIARSIELRNALSLVSRIAAIQTVHKGETVSYGGTYRVKRPLERIGVIPLGYFDGIHRRYSNRGSLLIHGKPAPIVGAVCMDFLMVDITDIPDAQVHDKVLVFGQDEMGHTLSPEAFATRGEGSVYELITCLGPRIQRVFVYDDRSRRLLGESV
jgi:alanine racemase/UDP-N-acetylmuramoyl-tripeptide--D-alanyl-D-alanine ligase